MQTGLDQCPGTTHNTQHFRIRAVPIQIMPGKITSILLTFTFGAFFYASLEISSKIKDAKIETKGNISATNPNTIIDIKSQPWLNFSKSLAEKNVPLLTAHIQGYSVVAVVTTESPLLQNATLYGKNSPVIESSENSQTALFFAKELLSDNKKTNNFIIQEIAQFPLTAEQVPTETKIRANIRKKIMINKPHRIATKGSNATKDLVGSTTIAKNAKKESSLLLRPMADGIASSFGKRVDPINNTMKFHKGIDISRPPGTKVFAWSDGVISQSGWLRGYGLTVDVTHADGMKTRYAHLMRAAVKKGQKITKGQIVGRVGDTGRTTGPNLHFEVAVAGKIRDPQDHLSRIAEIVGDDIGAINNG
jgi:murein DD-endopeptidase MepM/ murein hydrolase activator NlpD